MTSSTDRSEVLHAFGLGEDDLTAWDASGLPDEAFDDWLAASGEGRQLVTGVSAGRPERRLG